MNESNKTTEKEAVNVENLKITIQPKKNCRKCYGTGRIGFIEGDTNNPMICSCVMKVYKKLQTSKAESTTTEALKSDEKVNEQSANGNL